MDRVLEEMSFTIFSFTQIVEGLHYRDKIYTAYSRQGKFLNLKSKVFPRRVVQIRGFYTVREFFAVGHSAVKKKVSFSQVRLSQVRSNQVSQVRFDSIWFFFVFLTANCSTAKNPTDFLHVIEIRDLQESGLLTPLKIARLSTNFQQCSETQAKIQYHYYFFFWPQRIFDKKIDKIKCF